MGVPVGGKLFICYRRDDSADITGRFYDRLVARFGRDTVFKDVDSIPLGTDFRTHIDATIRQCSAAIVVIGQQWLGTKGADSGRRIDDELDHVRLEIQSVLRQQVPVIPVLVHDARQPEPQQLPESIRALSYRNGASIRPDPHFNSDVNFIISHLERIMMPAAVPPPPVPPAAGAAPVATEPADRSPRAPKDWTWEPTLFRQAEDSIWEKVDAGAPPKSKGDAGISGTGKKGAEAGAAVREPANLPKSPAESPAPGDREKGLRHRRLARQVFWAATAIAAALATITYVCRPTGAVAQYDIGVMYRDGYGLTKDYGEALRWFQKAANQGYAPAQCDIGAMYRDGKGVAKDYVQALSWFQKAAAQGGAEARYSIGRAYENGYGVKKDPSQALVWYEEAAAQGYAEAQYSIGWAYENGYGVKKDLSQALVWYEKAADQGNVAAQTDIGVMYRDGYGVAKDYVQALSWFQMAAEQGNAAAQTDIGLMYRDGCGVTKDYGEALRWFQKAADQGYVDAQYDVGWAYENGFGVKQDFIQALVWYERAAAQGQPAAQLAVQRLYMSGR